MKLAARGDSIPVKDSGPMIQERQAGACALSLEERKFLRPENEIGSLIGWEDEDKREGFVVFIMESGRLFNFAAG